MSADTAGLFRLAAKNAATLVSLADGPGQPFYLIHDLAGGIGEYRKLAHLLQRRVYGVQVPAARLVPSLEPQSIAEIAGDYATRLDAHRPEGPFVLGGYCFGSILALATAQQLRARGREVALLVAIEGAPYNVIRETGWWLYWRLLVEFGRAAVRKLPRAFAARLGLCAPPGGVPPANMALWRRIKMRVRLFRYELRGERTETARRLDNIGAFPLGHRLFMDQLLRLMQDWTPVPYPAPVQVYLGTDRSQYPFRRRDLIWRAIAAQSHVAWVAGSTHSEILHSPNVEMVARHLRDRLAAE